MTARAKSLVGVVLSLQVALAVLAWRDLDRQPIEKVRGTKRTWRILILLNPGNSVAFWLLGRRRGSLPS